MLIHLKLYVCLEDDLPPCLVFLLTRNVSFLRVCCLFQKSVWVSADWELGREVKGSTGDSLEVQVHEWHGWTSLWPHQSRTSSVSMVVPSKSCVLRGSEDTVCGLCTLISGSHGKGYYTTAASVFALAPRARHDPRADVLCRPSMVPWSNKISSFFRLAFSWARSFREKSHFIYILQWMNLYIYNALSKRCIGRGGFGFGCCLWSCEDPAHCLLKSQYPASHRFMGMPAQNCPTWLSNPLGACAEVTERQREREGDYVKVS